MVRVFVKKITIQIKKMVMVNVRRRLQHVVRGDVSVRRIMKKMLVVPAHPVCRGVIRLTMFVRLVHLVVMIAIKRNVLNVTRIPHGIQVVRNVCVSRAMGLLEVKRSVQQPTQAVFRVMLKLIVRKRLAKQKHCLQLQL